LYIEEEVPVVGEVNGCSVVEVPDLVRVRFICDEWRTVVLASGAGPVG
jgi:hypothetical protein